MSQKLKMQRVRPLTEAQPRLVANLEQEPAMKPKLKPKEFRAIERRDNDEFRRSVTVDQAHATESIIALGPSALAEILKRIRLFETFNPNDRKCLRDTGVIGYRGHAIAFAIIPDIAAIPDDVTYNVGYPRLMVIRFDHEG